MGHGITNMIGVDTRGYDKKVRRLLPDYMTMGQAGMAGMTEMGMKMPPNSIPMVGGIGPYDEITMGGMFTILKVRENLSNYDVDPGWYEPPAGTIASLATAQSLRQNSIEEDGRSAPHAPASAMKSWEQSPRSKPNSAMPQGHEKGH